jgi:hypothetical protein
MLQRIVFDDDDALHDGVVRALNCVDCRAFAHEVRRGGAKGVADEF